PINAKSAGRTMGRPAMDDAITLGMRAYRRRYSATTSGLISSMASRAQPGHQVLANALGGKHNDVPDSIREEREMVRPRKCTLSSRAPSFAGLRPASEAASRAKRANKNYGTRHEILLGRELWRMGLRYRKNMARLPGKPDIVFSRARVVVFCDGDFWHR